MDAVEFLKTAPRMCRTHENCEGCPGKANACFISYVDKDENPEGVVAAVEKWAKGHPIKTRQSEFLKMFPDADLKIITRLLPCSLDKTLKPLRCAKYGYLSITCRCDRCRDDYWNEEVTDND